MSKKPTEDHNKRMAEMTFSSVYPHYLSKVQGKGRTEEELHAVIEWLTGFDSSRILALIQEAVSFERFFAQARLNPQASQIKGLICGYRIEEIENPITRQVRYLDKLVDDLAKGKSLDKILLQPTVDLYLLQGCMRCPLGATPQCKVHAWQEALRLLRKIVLQTGLQEGIKWGAPVYTWQGNNVVSISALKDGAVLGFFKGVLLTDVHKILQQQGTLQSGRILTFQNTESILNIQSILLQYIEEAIALEKSGAKVTFSKELPPYPSELETVFSQDPDFKKAFLALTPGRQRGYLLHFSKAKQSQTRLDRIQKYRASILAGKGMQD
jgi:uncharacterized protein YdeI (YjbR/CyaY-like superfamily)